MGLKNDMLSIIKTHFIALRTHTGWKWRDRKDTPSKCLPKEVKSGYTYIRQNSLI